MSILELLWRIQQKVLQKSEYNKFFTVHKPVIEIPLSKELEKAEPIPKQLYINWNNSNYKFFNYIELLGGFDYQIYKSRWNAGYQTENEWPVEEFSYNITVSQREDIGDIRTNWELNRHFQFVGLAKNYYISREKRYLEELVCLFKDWNSKNLFLHGVQWTSAMEVSVRVVSWSYMYAFVKKADPDNKFLNGVSHGIKVMAGYILKHKARYSSANNHLIVEMFGVGVAGFLFGINKWIEIAVNTLTDELPKQNYPDGVNKEMSLHYQAFIMEAYGLMWILMKNNKMQIPVIWEQYLKNMSRFVADSCGKHGEVISFGDNDNGKILDFTGKKKNYYEYILQLMGCVLNVRYTEKKLMENICWIVDDKTLDEYYTKDLYNPPLVSVYDKGGYTFLRSEDHKLLIGFDYAELGFGSIAAHGHADALSIQVFCSGMPVLADPGSYNYHVPKKIRNENRKTVSHNTVYVEGTEQAEMLGPFLWGKRFKTGQNKTIQREKDVEIESTILYNGITHTRKIIFDYNRKLIVEDYVKGNGNKDIKQVWLIPDVQNPVLRNNILTSEMFSIRTDGTTGISNGTYSNEYGIQDSATYMYAQLHNGYIKTEIQIEE
jgi:Heparinase II/III-like protein.